MPIISEDGDFMEVSQEIVDCLERRDVIYFCSDCNEYHINTGDSFGWDDIDNVISCGCSGC